MPTLRTLVYVAAALLLPLSGAAQEAPETVYGRFHRAAAAGDLEEMLNYAPDQQRAEIAAMSPAQKAASAKMAAAMLPRGYVLRGKAVVAPDGQSARLTASGTGTALVGDKPETLYGTIRMVLERGHWKVAASEWSTSDPGPAAAPKPAAAPDKGAKPAAQKTASPSRAPVVGSLGGEPERKLGVQKPPCIYKPVMSAEDLENCR